MIIKRSFLGFIGLSIITCGIYPLYWIYVTSNDVNEMCGSEIVNPLIAVLLHFLTCGLYTYYWMYVVGNEVHDLGNYLGANIKDNGTTYLLFMLLGVVSCGIFNLIAYYLFFKNLGICTDYYNHKMMSGNN